MRTTRAGLNTLMETLLDLAGPGPLAHAGAEVELEVFCRQQAGHPPL